MINHVELNGKSVLTNGLEAMLKYNPVTSAVLPLVLRSFRQNLALTLQGAGVLLGDYVYRVVPYNEDEDEEGPAYPLDEDNAAFAITATSSTVRVSRAALRQDSPEITHWRIYRSEPGGSWPVLALVATVAWATTTYDDNIADDILDFANEGLNIYIGVPMPKPYLCVHNDHIFGWGDIPCAEGQAGVTNGSKNVTPQNGAVWGFYLEGKEFHAEGDPAAYMIDEYDPTNDRLVLDRNYQGTTRTDDYRICGDPDELVWCEPGFENEWPAGNMRYINHKEADKPGGILALGDAIMLPKSSRTYALLYNNEPQIPYSKAVTVSTEYGCIAHRTAKIINGAAVWLCRQGLVQASSGRVQRLGQVEMGEFVGDNLALDADGTKQICSAVVLKSKGMYVCFWPDLTALVGCNRALVWHFLDNKFSTYSFDIEVTSAEIVKGPDGTEACVLGDANGYLWEFPWGDADGPANLLAIEGAVEAYYNGSPCAIFDSDANFPTSGLGLEGMAVYVYDGTGAGQVRRILLNTADTLWLEDCFDADLDETSLYYVGSIRARYQTGWLDYGTLARAKRGMYAHLAFAQNDSVLRFNVYGDFGSTPFDLTDKNPRAVNPVDAGLLDMSADGEDSAHLRGHHRIELGGIRQTYLSWEVLDDRPLNPWSLFDLAMDIEPKEP